MKKYVISGLFIIGFLSYVAYTHLSGGDEQVSAAVLPNTPTQTVQTDTPTTQSPSGAGTPPPTTTTSNSSSASQSSATTMSSGSTAPAPSGRYADGTYVGSVADAYYGNVQVEAIISRGKLTNVKFLQYPNDRSTSRMINEQAMPELISEAVQAQSANVSGVSGASDTSAAFEQSLSSALSQA